MHKLKNKTVIVTGGSGFIGSAFLRKYVPLHPDTLFLNVDDLRAGSSEAATAGLSSYRNYRFIRAALENIEELEPIFSEYAVTDIIHFAAESDVDRSIISVMNTMQTNVIGTINLLELGKKCRFVYVSTDEVYGPANRGRKMKESDPQKPSSPYSASKAAAENFVMAYHRTYGVNVVVTRGCNTFGPYQDYTKLIPVAMKALREGRKIPIYGDGSQVREWMPVDLHAEGVFYAWRWGISGEVYNIGTHFSLTNISLLKLLVESLGLPFEGSFEFVKDRPGHDQAYSIDAHKISRLLWPKDQSRTLIPFLIRDLEDTAKWYYQQNRD